MDSKSSRNESSSINDMHLFNEHSPDDRDLLMKENIFHSHFHVSGKLCSIIIDEGNSVSMASMRLVEKLKLPT
ncbi:hypothetical protein CR513_36965, partial [Mucuna pruriens]